MNNVLDYINLQDCYGCASCSQKCKQSAIKMVPSHEGFLMPEVDTIMCTGCGACISACQILKPLQANNATEGIHYIAQSKNRKEVLKSSSGGAFYTIAKYLMQERQALIFGALIDEDLVVRHKCIESVEDLALLQGSKYVQSEVGHTYSDVKEKLTKGRYVLYSGTPCQIAGLYRFLGHSYENLITCDIICHGTPSPKLLSYYLVELQKTILTKITSYRFRFKNPLFLSGSSYVFQYKDQNKKWRREASNYNPYFKLFLSGITFRETCYKCPYAQINRIGDFTIGDCDSHSSYPNFHPYESNSTLMLNTEKSKKLWYSGLESYFDYSELDINKEAERNKQLSRPFERPKERDNIYEHIYSKNHIDLVREYGMKYSLLGKVKFYILLYMPASIIRVWAKIKK